MTDVICNECGRAGCARMRNRHQHANENEFKACAHCREADADCLANQIDWREEARRLRRELNDLKRQLEFK